MMIAFVIAGTFTNASLSAFAVAVSSAVVALLMKQPAHREYADELTERLRHPVRYAVQHPIETLRRMLR